MKIPALDLDLFAPVSLTDPFDDYRRLRDTGPVVRLARPDVYAISRFADVQAALRAADILISGEGVGFSAAFNAPKGMNVIQSDGDIHRRLRAAVTRPLTPAKLREVRIDLKALIATRVAALVDTGEFDAIAMLARLLPVEAVAHLVGLPDVGRERMLEWAAAAFNVIGPNLDPADVGKMKEAFAFMASLSDQTVASGSWAAQLFGAARDGKLTHQEAMAAISAYVIPSLDTTIYAKGHLLNNLAKSPEQWAMLRADPGLIPAAVLEGVRHSSVIRWFSRVAQSDYAVDDAVVPAGGPGHAALWSREPRRAALCRSGPLRHHPRCSRPPRLGDRAASVCRDDAGSHRDGSLARSAGRSRRRDQRWRADRRY